MGTTVISFSGRMLFEGELSTTAAWGTTTPPVGAPAEANAPSPAPTTNVSTATHRAAVRRRRNGRRMGTTGASSDKRFAVVRGAGRLVERATSTDAVGRVGLLCSSRWPSLEQKQRVSSKARRQLGQSFMIVDLRPRWAGNLGKDAQGPDATPTSIAVPWAATHDANVDLQRFRSTMTRIVYRPYAGASHHTGHPYTNSSNLRREA
jgi:hypothetical protein